MPQLCLYFQLHQPYRLRDYSIFEVGRTHQYFSDQAETNGNAAVFKKVAKKSYIPMLSLLNDLLMKQPESCFSLSASGIFLEQALKYEPQVISKIKQLVATGRVELLAETYYHSLSSLYSPDEFRSQVKLHQQLIKKLFGVTAEIFRNTELVYADHIGQLVADMGFKGLLTEAVDRYLEGQPRTQLFSSYTAHRIPLMLKHAQLSDDVAFRFSDKTWVSWPLTADTYINWLNSYSESEYINLFMDFETFGEHQWADTGIFDFFAKVVTDFPKYSWNKFVTPSQVMSHVDANKLPFYKVPEPISWADVDRDLSAWRDNALQHDTLRLIYSLEKDILKTGDKLLIEDWRKLQTSDHFYYMCIKWSNDGDVHAYFSPYKSPNEAYVRYSTVLADIQSRLIENKI